MDDKDVINILTDNVAEAPKPEPRKPKICGFCKTENKHINLFCWNCGNVFSDKDKKQMGIEAIIQPYEVKELRQENKELRQNLHKNLLRKSNFHNKKNFENRFQRLFNKLTNYKE